MKEEHFIKDIEIKNFKCFEDFKAEGFGRVNLIGGKNNVGKTAFMEALYVNIYSYKSDNNPSMALSDIVINRYNQVILQEFFKGQNKVFIIRYNIMEKIARYNKADIKSNIQDILTLFSPTDLKQRDKRGLIKYFLGNTPITNDKLEESYGRILELSLENEIDEKIKYIDPNIKSFRIINSQPKCNFINSQAFVDIHELGDGLYKYISILFALFICRDSYLFIDEVDNGIHYTSLDKLWEIILTISKEQNVQVFATTHSKEAIESYARVAKKLGDEKVTYSILSKLKSGKIHHSLYDYALLETALKQEHEVR